MSRSGGMLLFIAVMGLLPVGAARGGDSAAEAKRAAEVRKKLEATINFPGMDDPDTKFGEGLAFLSRIAGVTFEINEQAFKDEQIDDVSAKPIGREIPKMTGVPVSKALRRLLDRIPINSGITYAVRGGVVEITTRRYTSLSNWHRRLESPQPESEEGGIVFPPEVSVAFDKRELQEALQEIADATGVNVVLDAKAKDKGKTAITATLHDAAVDTVVQLLADMADLQAVTVDDILYVTTKENAKALREDKTRMKKVEEPMKAEPAPK